MARASEDNMCHLADPFGCLFAGDDRAADLGGSSEEGPGGTEPEGRGEEKPSRVPLTINPAD